MLKLTSLNFKEEVEDFRGTVVIDLYADWCGPCKMLAPVLAELEGEYPDVKFCKVNVDDERELAMKFNVSSIPFVAIIRNNPFEDMSIGYVPKAEDINIEGLDGITIDTIRDLLTVDVESWLADIDNIKEFYAQVGDAVPQTMYDELAALEARLSK